MNSKRLVSTSVLCILLFSLMGGLRAQKFNLNQDFLLVHFDCKTDVDDVQTMAALATLLKNKIYQNVKYHTITGTYGVQEGLYVPPNKLMRLAFKENWSDAHNNQDQALSETLKKIKATLTQNGDLWIADAGQSDFSARLVAAIQYNYPSLNTKKRIHIVQHSDWNESVTAKQALNYAKNNTDYIKIPDGNATNNGTPGFRDPNYTIWNTTITDPELFKIWKLAISISNQYNGKDGRYLNEAIASGGLDFSDLSEVCWILDIQDVENVDAFFKKF
ncbi:hypothetical protein N9H69_02630 [Flavobacteriaceae bacterium]|nr:hypothetical protein [Flavobacteriaceae bacterium]MDC3354799.1 hypothetical protein [Flavobacteriaceae bacterium]